MPSPEVDPAGAYTSAAMPAICVAAASRLRRGLFVLNRCLTIGKESL